MREQASELWKVAVAAQARGETARAETLFQRLIEQHPSSFEAIDAMFVLGATRGRADPLPAEASVVRSPRSTRYG